MKLTAPRGRPNLSKRGAPVCAFPHRGRSLTGCYNRPTTEMSGEQEARDPRGFLKLFTFDKKRDLAKYTRTIVLYQRDFVDVVLACQEGALPFRHRAHYSERVPAHLVPSAEGLEALAGNRVGLLKPQARNTVRKIGHLMRERRWYAGHMFYTQNFYEWHFLVFDRADQAEGLESHWRGGSHLHFVNWLWPRLDPQEVWARFVEHNEKPASSLHIRDNSGAAEFNKRLKLTSGRAARNRPLAGDPGCSPDPRDERRVTHRDRRMG